MFASMGRLQAVAQVAKPAASGNGLGSAGGVRGGGTPVVVVVKMAGTAVAGATLTFQAVPSAPVTAAVTATTDGDGVANINLPAGSYTVTGTTASGSANMTIAVVDSTSTMYVNLTLAPNTP